MNSRSIELEIMKLFEGKNLPRVVSLFKRYKGLLEQEIKTEYDKEYTITLVKLRNILRGQINFKKKTQTIKQAGLMTKGNLKEAFELVELLKEVDEIGLTDDREITAINFTSRKIEKRHI